ncbi:ORF144 [White spot syndrome virus]|uniref:ORF144 n=1 Tax=White spot syndrome virus TaxID=342409 RepID=A0A2D3I5M2_9VIRU|nr:ORF144 [White spot syndrome virus]
MAHFLTISFISILFLCFFIISDEEEVLIDVLKTIFFPFIVFPFLLTIHPPFLLLLLPLLLLLMMSVPAIFNDSKKQGGNTCNKMHYNVTFFYFNKRQ